MRLVTVVMLGLLAGCYDPSDMERGFAPALPGTRQHAIDVTHDNVPVHEIPELIPAVPLR